MDFDYEDREEDEEELDEDEEEDSQDEDMEAGPGAGRRAPTYDVDGLHEKLEDIGWTTEAAWDETLTLTSETATHVDNVDDDLARELAFYNQALAAAQEAIKRFDKAGVSWLRPLDYYAEMVKTDAHMAKVKDQLMFEQRQIEMAEERRKQREQKQYAKQVQAERLKQKAQDKKSQIESISKLRKQREKSGYEGEVDIEEQLKGVSARPQKFMDRNRKPQGAQGGNKSINKKRQARDAKYGFGGNKRLNKQNDAYSAADMDGYKTPKKGGLKKGGKGGPLKAKGGVKKGPAKKAAGKQRPGKTKRQAMKGKAGR